MGVNVRGKPDRHSQLFDLDYANSGHTGFMPAGGAATDLEAATLKVTTHAAIGGMLISDGVGLLDYLPAGATTDILVGGGAASPVWTAATGTGAPVRNTAPTFNGIVTMLHTLDVSAATLTLATNQGNVTSGLNLSYRERPAINFGIIGVKTKPTMVELGAYTLLSMPIWNSGGNADEQIFFNHSVVRRWNGTSDLKVGCVAIIDTANTSKKFQLELAWMNAATGVVAPTTVNTTYCEVTTGTDAQYMMYKIEWTVDYNINPANPLLPNQIMVGRIRRVAKSAGGTEIDGEVMLHGFYVQYVRDKIGVSA